MSEVTTNYLYLIMKDGQLCYATTGTDSEDKQNAVEARRRNYSNRNDAATVERYTLDVDLTEKYELIDGVNTLVTEYHNNSSLYYQFIIDINGNILNADWQPVEGEDTQDHTYWDAAGLKCQVYSTGNIDSPLIIYNISNRENVEEGGKYADALEQALAERKKYYMAQLKLNPETTSEEEEGSEE